jgi:hypothetical protein
MVVGGIVVLAFAVLALLFRNRCGPKSCWVLFLGIALPTLIVTSYVAASTIVLNLESVTRGPVHWHADYEIWVCGQPVRTQEPTGLTNRVGTPVFHHHGDNRIHVEGVLDKLQEASLARFFHVIGGVLLPSVIAVPTDQGLLTAANGARCPDGTPGLLQAFRITMQDNQIVQQKLPFFADYVLAPESNVPPGDCIIIEFSQEKQRTNHLCASYRAAISKGSVDFVDWPALASARAGSAETAISAGLASQAQRGELYGG